MLLVSLIIGFYTHAAPPSATSLVERLEAQSLGRTFEGTLTMTVRRTSGSRQLKIHSWTQGQDKAMVKVLAPAKERGVAFLRLEYVLSQYLPKVERTIKVPPSLMLQSWMGSDFTNDDLVKTSRITRDYDCENFGDDRVGETVARRVRCLPKSGAPVVWGKLELWIEPKHATLLRQDFYTENGERVKELRGEDIKTMDGHVIPSKITVTTIKGQTSTTIEYLRVRYDREIPASVFRPAFLDAPLTDD